jgi:hypothetical protein
MKKIQYALLVLLGLLLTGCWTTKSGQKSGVVVKIAREGRIWPTYEAELVKGGVADERGNSRVFLFSIGPFHSDLVEKAERALHLNEHVVVIYHCEEFVAPWQGQTRCFADDIQFPKIDFKTF